MLKPYIIVAVLVGFLAAFGFGFRMGGNSVKVEYQEKLNKQQAEADQIIQQNIDDLLTTQAENDLIKYNLEKERQSHAKETNRIRTELASAGLRFIPTTSGQSGSNQVPNPANAAIDASAASIELPKEITSNLRELAFDCDTLRDDYQLLYQFNHGAK